MGTWSVGIMGNDLAMDLMEDYKAAFASLSPNKAVEKLDKENENLLDDDEIFEYYYSLALFMWKHGILTSKVKERALDWIDNKRGLERFIEAGESVLKDRNAVLQRFKTKLNSPMPIKKKIALEEDEDYDEYCD